MPVNPDIIIRARLRDAFRQASKKGGGGPLAAVMSEAIDAFPHWQQFEDRMPAEVREIFMHAESLRGEPFGGLFSSQD